MRHLRASVTIGLLLLLLAAVPVLADDNAVSVELRVVYASKESVAVDEGVKDLHQRLSQLFDYTQYKALSTARLAGAFGQAQSFTLPDGRKLVLKPMGIDDSGKVNVHLQIPGLVETDFRLKDGGKLILGGPRYEKGVLILVITVKTR